MKPRLMIVLALIFLFPSSFYSISSSEQKDIIEKADLFLDMMEYKAAIKNYLKILSENTDQREIRKNIGYAYYKLDRIDDTLKYLKEELTLYPDSGDAYDLLVYVLFKCKRIEEYCDFLENLDLLVQMDKKNPNSGSGDFRLGVYFKEKRKFKDAKNFFRRALERGYNPVKCFVQLADIEFIKESLQILFAVLNEARKSCVTPNRIQSKEYGLIFEFHFLYGLSYYKLFRTYHDEAHAWAAYLQLAVRHFEEALKLRPDSKDTLLNLGCIHYNLGQIKNAIFHYGKYLYLGGEKEKEVRELLKSLKQKKSFHLH